MRSTRLSTGLGLILTAGLLLFAAGPVRAQRPNYYSEDYTGPAGQKTPPGPLAYLRVRLPAGAELWINNEKYTRQTGSVREFKTPALDPDRVYVYMVRARWTEADGINVEKSLRVRTIAGTRVTVNFVRPPAEQPRPIIQAPVTPAPVVVQQPVNWSAGYAPRSFTPSRP